MSGFFAFMNYGEKTPFPPFRCLKTGIGRFKANGFFLGLMAAIADEDRAASATHMKAGDFS